MENYQVVKFYTSILHQYHRKARAQGIKPIYAPGGVMPPFQIKGSGGTLYVRRYEDDTIVATISLEQRDFEDYNLAVYPGTTLAIPNGLYYYHVVSGTNTYYSDLIGVVMNTGFLRIDYWHGGEFPVSDYHFDFEGAFKFYVFLRPSSETSDILGKPQYFYEEQVHSREGYPFPEMALSGKRYLFETLVTEPQADGLRVVPLFSNVEIHAEGITKVVHDVNMLPEWEATGYLAILTFEFLADTVVVRRAI